MLSRTFTLNSALTLGVILLSLMSISPSFAKVALIERTINTDKGEFSKRKRVKLNESNSSVIKRKSITRDDGSQVYSRNSRRVDGQGNGYKRDTSAYRRENGSQGYRVQQSGKTSDGEYWKSVDKYRETANGGIIQQSRKVSLDENKNVLYSKDVAGESASGKQYLGNVLVKDGVVTRAYTCTDSSGATVECR